MAESIFPEVKAITPRVLCECVGGAVSRAVDLAAKLSPLPQTTQLELSTHVREPQPQGQLFVPKPGSWDVT